MCEGRTAWDLRSRDFLSFPGAVVGHNTCTSFIPLLYGRNKFEPSFQLSFCWVCRQNSNKTTEQHLLIPRDLEDVVGWQASKCIMFMPGFSFAHLLWYIFDKERLVLVCGAAICYDHAEDYKRDASRQEQNTFRMSSDSVIIKINGKDVSEFLCFYVFFASFHKGIFLKCSYHQIDNSGAKMKMKRGEREKIEQRTVRTRQWFPYLTATGTSMICLASNSCHMEWRCLAKKRKRPIWCFYPFPFGF